MCRRLFTPLSVLSLVLCLTTAVLWARSYFVSDAIGFREARSVSDNPNGWDLFSCRVYTGCGGVAIQTGRGTFGMPAALYSSMSRQIGKRQWFWERHTGPVFPGLVVPDDSRPDPRPFWVRAGFDRESLGWYHEGNVDSSNTTTLPIWPLTFATAVLPVAWLFSRRNRADGHCTRCGYNLTGNTSGVCPECGTPKTAGVKA